MTICIWHNVTITPTTIIVSKAREITHCVQLNKSNNNESQAKKKWDSKVCSCVCASALGWRDTHRYCNCVAVDHRPYEHIDQPNWHISSKNIHFRMSPQYKNIYILYWIGDSNRHNVHKNDQIGVFSYVSRRHFYCLSNTFDARLS